MDQILLVAINAASIVENPVHRVLVVSCIIVVIVVIIITLLGPAPVAGTLIVVVIVTESHWHTCSATNMQLRHDADTKITDRKVGSLNRTTVRQLATRKAGL